MLGWRRRNPHSRALQLKTLAGHHELELVLVLVLGHRQSEKQSRRASPPRKRQLTSNLPPQKRQLTSPTGSQGTCVDVARLVAAVAARLVALAAVAATLVAVELTSNLRPTGSQVAESQVAEPALAAGTCVDVGAARARLEAAVAARLEALAAVTATLVAVAAEAAQLEAVAAPAPLEAPQAEVVAGNNPSQELKLLRLRPL